MKLSELVEKYVALRDKKNALADAYKKQVQDIERTMDKIEGTLLATFEKAGIESTRSSSGHTAYVSTRTTASVGDRDAFFGFVREHEEWSLLEVRCAKTAVEQYMEANQELPPGVNWRSEKVVNIRRSS